MPDFKWNTLKYSKKRALLIKKYVSLQMFRDYTSN